MKNSTIIHHPNKQLLTLAINEKDRAFIEYQLKDGVYYLIHSEVPTNLRGQGIGRKLVQKTFDYLQLNNLQAKAICTYIRRVVSRNPAWQTFIRL